MGDLLAIDEDPLYAKPNKKSKKQAESDMQASGCKGKSATGKGKRSCKCCNCSINHFSCILEKILKYPLLLLQ